MKHVVLAWQCFQKLTDARGAFTHTPCVYVQIDSNSGQVRIGKASKRSCPNWFLKIRNLDGTVKLSRICPFCGRILLDQRLRINDLAVAAGGENAAKLLDLTVPPGSATACGRHAQPSPDRLRRVRGTDAPSRSRSVAPL